MRKAFRSIYFNNERKWKSKQPFDDILQVGIQKAIGYVCLESEEDYHFADNFIKTSEKMTFIDTSRTNIGLHACGLEIGK